MGFTTGSLLGAGAAWYMGTVSSRISLQDYVLMKYGDALVSSNYLSSSSSSHFVLEATTRIAILGGVGAIAVGFLIAQRLFSAIPFFPPKDYRSYVVFNKKDFLYRYSEDEVPSRATIEPLIGTRLVWSYATAAVLAGLVFVNGILLGLRIQNGLPIDEEIAGLCFSTLLLLLWGFRFCATPYRRSLFYTVTVGSFIPLVCVFERDVWPRLLFHPTRAQLEAMRTVVFTIALIGLDSCVILCSLFTPRVWYPADPYSDRDAASPEQTACFASYVLSYSWIGDLVFKAFWRDLDIKDLPHIPDYDRADLWAKKLEKDRKSTTMWTLLWLMRYDLLFMTIASFLIGASHFFAPWAMKNLLASIEGSAHPPVTPWVYVAALLTAPVISAFFFEFYVFNSTRLIVRVKAALTQSLLIKTLRIRFTADSPGKDADKGGTTPKVGSNKDSTKGDQQDNKTSRIGKINNLMSTDLEQLTDARDLFLLIGSGPVDVIFAVIFLYQLLGWSSLVGVALMLVSLIVPGYMAKLMAAIQTNARKATDARIGLMNEVLNSIRIIKFFGLENAFIGKVKEKRDNELRLWLVSTIYSLFFYCITSLLPVVNMLVTFGLYTMVMGKPLTASTTFTAISLFGILRSQFSWVAWIVKQILYAYVSFKRIDQFLMDEEEIAQAPTAPDEGFDETSGIGNVPAFRNATLSWHVPGSQSDNGFRLSNLNLECASKGLTVVSGPVGSGKSSFLLGLLEEMVILEGSVSLPRTHGVAYCAQIPWLQNATIRENILFGYPYDEKRYKMTLDGCALVADLDLFEDGDQTEIGELGITLSGGQKARLALARAVYSPAEIVLLDDVLSALDAGTMKIVFDRCIKGEILNGRTVVLVTHHVSLVAPAIKMLIMLDDGNVVSAGPPSLAPELLTSAEDRAENIETALDERASEENTVPAVPVNDRSLGKGKLVKEEERAMGRVPKTMIWEYIKKLGGMHIVLTLLIASVLLELLSIGTNLFVGLWSDAYQRGPVNVAWWLGAYGSLLVGLIIFNGIAYGLWYWAEWLAAKSLHEQLVKAVLYAPIRFFDTTPIGRIINRFSKDIKSLDDLLGPYLHYSLIQIIEILLEIGILAGLVPTFLIPTIFVCILGFACGEMYVRAQMGVKRIVSVKESPLISHFGDTISGVVTIRAFSCQKRFLEENLRRIDDYTLPQQTLYNLNRWIGVRINSLTGVVGFAAGCIAVTSTSLPPGLIGFSLINAISFSSSILYTVRYLNQLEVELNSLERVNEYIKIESEAPAIAENRPPAAWPTAGDVQVRDLSVRYSVDGPDVLHRISFDIKPCERVGIVGRTGAGKSSLALSLLRFTTQSSGTITINGLDISKVNLDALRQRVTIIPQDPVLFSGTIRSNLDPFGEMDESDLQNALEGSGLVNTGLESENDSGISSGTATPDHSDGRGLNKTKKITLDTTVTAGGSNLSQGQRQLLAFSRALLRRSKLVILDEATSSTDHKTDQRIQETLKSSFPDSSILCIAHRLRTVVSFDKILVLDNKGEGGEVVEFDTPYNLLSKGEDGILFQLAKKTGEFEELLEIAAGISGSTIG